MKAFHYLPNTDDDRREMLEKIGVKSIDELLARAVPEELMIKGELNLPEGMSDVEVSQILERLAAKNTAATMKNFAGGGAYDMYVPAAVDEISSRPEFYTAYTPYQPEVSQGTLTAIFEFQTMITGLTGMDIANASMYDGASAAAEAVVLAIHRTGRKRIVYSKGLNPLYLEVIKTYTHGFGVQLVELPLDNGKTRKEELSKIIDDETACFIIQNPNFFGVVEDCSGIADIVHSRGALFIVCIADPMSLGMLKPPGEYGADVVAGEGQQFGNYLYYGGPYLGFFAARRDFLRQMPGRIIGMTKDVEGRRGFVMTFQTREQHIRRARATSNICTNQQLCALRATVYLALLGEHGFKYLSKLLFDRAHYLAEKLSEIEGVSLLYDAPFYREFAVKLPKNAEEVVHKACEKGVMPGIALGKIIDGMENVLLVASSDKYGKKDMDEMVEVMNSMLA